MATRFPYYIWQNPSARLKIYPNRIAKLREFLLTYKEADLMDQYIDLPKQERAAKVTEELQVIELELSGLGDDHSALLQKVVDYLVHSPRNFKPWIKYIVIHFSGMRYDSAHGSWAEPRDLLKVLIKHNLFDASLLGGATPDILTGEQVLEALAELRPGGRNEAPAWAWLVMVLYTDLRLGYISANNASILDKGGQNTIPGYQEALMRGEPYSKALLDWLKPTKEISAKEKRFDSLTSWRDKHFKDYSLVVLRAMCNEISEHVHHLRLLNKASGGLNARPGWYLNFEKADDPQAITNVLTKKPGEGKQKKLDPNDFSNEVLPGLPADEKAYLRRPLSEAFFKPGASILWLGWVSSQPNEWQLTFPIRGYTFNRGDQAEKNWKYGTQAIPTLSGERTAFIRTEIADKEKKKEGGKKAKANPADNAQWLRWTHEAIVMDVVSLRAGRTVLTFETEPVTGLNRRYLGNLCNSAGGQPWWNVFVGYAGERLLDQFHQDYLAYFTDSELILKEEALPEGAPEFAGAAGDTTLPEAAGAAATSTIQAQYKKLTPRQRKAVAFYCQGLGRKQIARRMDISVKKVDELLKQATDQVGLTQPQALILYFSGIDFGRWNVLKESSY